jgi:hypothetical protein
MIPVPLPATDITDLAHTIQLAVAPVFLLTGIAGLLNVLAGRLARVVDRSRVLEAEFTAADHPGHAMQVWELRQLDQRMRYANNAIFLCSLSAVLVCLVVAGLFVAELANLGFARTMAVGFILAMVLLIAGLVLFLLEIRIALNSVRVREELLEREAGRKRRR